jgi:HAD superfamily hydrolase (TIGR01509 family)
VNLDALIFDFDGLILDTEWPEFATVRDEFAHHGVELVLEDWQGIVGRADHRHWFDWLEEETGRALERDVVVERRRQRHHALIAEQEILPGVLHHFEVVRCRDHVERAKPSPDLFLAALAALGADPQRSVALEDSHHGCSAAKAAGLVCVVVPNDVTRGAEFAHADLVVESLDEVSLADLTGLVRA